MCAHVCVYVAVAATDAAREIAAAIGGVSLVIDALRRFNNRSRVVQRACWALLSLAARNGTHTLVWLGHSCMHVLSMRRLTCVAWWRAGADTVALQIAIDGGVAAVVDAMEVCSDTVEVQVYGCWALANIAWNEGA